MKLDLDRYNERVKQWGQRMIREIKEEAAQMGIVHRSAPVFNGDAVLPASTSKGSSVAKLRAGFKQEEGAIAQVSVKLRRTLVYTHKGAGKGRAGIKGSKWVDRFGVKRTTNPKSFGKMATGGRVAKPFVNKVLEGEGGIEDLATIAGEELGDAVVSNILIK